MTCIVHLRRTEGKWSYSRRRARGLGAGRWASRDSVVTRALRAVGRARSEGRRVAGLGGMVGGQ